MAEDCKRVQCELLMNILKRQSHTEYGLRYRFSEMENREDFVKQHPLTTYSQYADYMDRIANGEENLLTVDKVLFLALSSGTTGKNKMFPITNVAAACVQCTILR